MKTPIMVALIFFCITTSFITEKNTPRKITIVDVFGNPQECTINLNNKKYKDTTEDGVCTLPEDCQPTDTYEIVPYDTDYNGDEFTCPNNKDKYVLLTVPQANNIKNNSDLGNRWTIIINQNPDIFSQVDSSQSKNIYAISAFSSNEYYAFYRSQNPKVDSARVNTIKYTAKFFGLENGIYTNPKTNYQVANQELINEVIKYQKENNIEVTGKIDGQTLKSMSGLTSFFKVYSEDFTPIIIPDNINLDEIK